MLTAHLPSGYLLARGIGWPGGAVMGAALLGAVAPDFDMLWFHFVDNGAVHHHRYWPHIPALWALVAAVALPLAARLNLWRPALAFFAAITLHLLLDTISGGILWGWPVSDRLMSLTTVAPTHSNWVWSFVFHWTFLFELLIWAATLTLLFRNRSPQ